VNPLYQKILPERLRPGRSHKFSDAALTAESLGIDSEHYLFSKLHSDYRADFPDLIHRSNFNIRIRKLKTMIEALRFQLVDTLAGREHIFSIDSMPIAVCRMARSKRLKICKQDERSWPASSYCAAQKQFYYGYKLHALAGMNGAIDMYDLSAANVHDLHYLKDVQNRKQHCHIIGDKAYDSIPLQFSLFEQNNIQLLSPARNYKDRYRPFPKHISRIRKRIETTFSKLCDQFNIKRNYAKSFNGIAARVIRKITAFTILQYINKIINNKPQNQIKHALA